MTNKISKDQEQQTVELYKKIKKAILSEKESLESMDNGLEVVCGALGTAIVTCIHENAQTREDGLEKIDQFCADLRRAYQDEGSCRKIT